MAASKHRGKKSHSSKPGGGRISGNPATRAADELERQRKALFSTAAAEARSWWDASIADVLANARVLEPVDGQPALENAACRLLGEELAVRVERERGGFDLPGWLVALAGGAAERLRDSGDVAGGLLLHAITAIGTDRAAKAAATHLFKLQHTEAAAELAARYPWAAAMSPARPSGDALIAVDGYGSRYLLVAPFQVPEHPDSAHWYAWDVDFCDTQRTVAAAVFTDPDSALADWKAAVGTPAADSALSPATEPAVVRELLAECLPGEMLEGSVMGDEDTGLLSEHFRMRNRATQLSKTMPERSSDRRAAARRKVTPSIADQVLDEFGEWFLNRHPEADFDEDIAATLIIDWFEPVSDLTRYSCSLHRVRALTLVIWDVYDDESAAGICALLPEWVTWCSEKTELNTTLADRSLAAARQSAALVRSTVEFDPPTHPRISE